MPAVRTDVHSPKNLVTEDYDFAFAYDAHPDAGGAEQRMRLLNALIDEGFRFGQVHGGDTCDHCGARLRYVAVMKHLPTRTLIKVGETCLANRFERASGEFHALRKQAQLDRQLQRVKKTRALFFAVHAPDAETAFEWCAERVENGEYGWEGMRHRFVSKITREGETSVRFLRAMMRDMVRTERREAERAERDRIEAENASPVVEGRIVVEGQVLATRWQESDYGATKKMLVRDDRGFKVWGTVPSAILDIEREDRVRFTATVEQSNDDETFGFYKRPSKAECLEDARDAEADADAEREASAEKAEAEAEARRLEEEKKDRHAELYAKRTKRTSLVGRMVNLTAAAADGYEEEVEGLAHEVEAIDERIAELERLTEVVE